MGRPKKVVEGASPEDNSAHEGFTVTNGDTPSIESSRCYHCRRIANGFPCVKGDTNQYKFCSVECFNKDKTI